MAVERERLAGPNEHRCIARQVLGYYRTLVIGGFYSLKGHQQQLAEEATRSTLVRALKHCITTHPILSAVIEDAAGKKPRFVKVDSLNTDDHLDFRGANSSPPSGENDETLLHRVLPPVLDQCFDDSDSIPPWKVFVFKAHANDDGPARYLILLGYYHSHGDGMAGIAFARTLLEGLNLAQGGQCPYDDTATCPSSAKPFLPPIEKVCSLTISWGFLLAPALGAYLPTFLANLLGFRASAVPEADSAWVGERTIWYDASKHETGVQVLRVPDAHVQAILRQCRLRGAKMTGLLHQLVVRALSEALPADAAAEAENFISQTAVDMRHMLEGRLTSNDMALCVTGYYEPFPRATADRWRGWARASSDATHPVWAAAKKTTDGLAATAGTLHNQPIGLLKYAPNMCDWTRGHIGKRRDASYELSNLTAFDPSTPTGEPWQIQSLAFAQPANTTGGALDVNVVTRKGGDMTVILSWERGVFGMGDEQGFAARICSLIKSYISELVEAS